MKKKSEVEELFAFHLQAIKLPVPTREFKFMDSRKFRFDFAWPEIRFAVDVDGGEWINGAHNRAKGMANDYEKMGEAMYLGWNVYRCTGSMVRCGDAINFVERYFELLQKR